MLHWWSSWGELTVNNLTIMPSSLNIPLKPCWTLCTGLMSFILSRRQWLFWPLSLVLSRSHSSIRLLQSCILIGCLNLDFIIRLWSRSLRTFWKVNWSEETWVQFSFYNCLFNGKAFWSTILLAKTLYELIVCLLLFHICFFKFK